MEVFEMDGEERRLWKNFRDALRRLLEHPDLSSSQRDYILKNIRGFAPEYNVIDLRSKQHKKKE